MKAHQLDAVADDVTHLCGPHTVIVPMQNGIPYWYFHKHGGPFENHWLHSVDPSGRIGRAIPPQRVIGCVVYPASELVAPGVVRHIEGDRFPLGELDGSISERAQALSDAFARAGFKAPVLDDIRAEIWLKLWGNLVFNPVSALTRATLERHRALRAHARTGRIDDGRGADRGQQARHHVPRDDRQAHRRRREGRRAQDLDAAGRRGRPRARGRSAGRLGGRTGAPDPRRPRRTSTRCTH